MDRILMQFEHRGIDYKGMAQSMPEKGFAVGKIPKWFYVSLNHAFFTYLVYNPKTFQYEIYDKSGEPIRKADREIAEMVNEYILLFYE